MSGEQHQTDIYFKLTKLHEIDLIDGNPKECREIIMPPMIGDDSLYGAAAIISTLCFPEEDNHLERIAFFDHLFAKSLKKSAPVGSEERKRLVLIPAYKSLIDIPNKRINDKLGKACKRLDNRFKAACAIVTKISTDPNFTNQVSLRQALLIISKKNSIYFKLFLSGKNDDDVFEMNNFMQRVINTSKPVLHLAIALYCYLLPTKAVTIDDILRLANTGHKWLEDVIYKSEVFRLNLNSMLPKGTKSQDGRFHNIKLARKETIMVLPFIDEISEKISKEDVLRLIFPNIVIE